MKCRHCPTPKVLATAARASVRSSHSRKNLQLNVLCAGAPSGRAPLAPVLVPPPPRFSWGSTALPPHQVCSSYGRGKRTSTITSKFATQSLARKNFLDAPEGPAKNLNPFVLLAELITATQLDSNKCGAAQKGGQTLPVILLDQLSVFLWGTPSLH